MKTILLVLLLTAFVVSALAVDGPARATPIVRTLMPSPAKAGGELVATGDHLGKDFVGSVFLTLGDETFPLEIKSQSEDSIKTSIPQGLKAARYGFMVLTRGEIPRYLDEPVFVNVE